MEGFEHAIALGPDAWAPIVESTPPDLTIAGHLPKGQHILKAFQPKENA